MEASKRSRVSHPECIRIEEKIAEYLKIEGSDVNKDAQVIVMRSNYFALLHTLLTLSFLLKE